MMEFDRTYPFTDMNDFKEWKWKDFYGDLKEAILTNAPEEMGKAFYVRRYVDSNHAGKKNTRRYCSGFFILLNTVLIQC